MAVESPNRSAISPLRFFNRTARVSQPGSVDAKNKLIEIDSTLKKILSIRKIEIDKTRLKKEEDKRVEKENKLEAGKFIVKGIGKLANKIPGKNTIQKFLIFMAFGWLYNTFSKYFDQFVGPLSTLINFSAKIIDVFAKITFSIFDGIVTFIDLGYKAWDVIRGKEDAEKLESAMNDVLLGVDRLFGGILTTLGILEQPINEFPVGSGAPATPKSQQQAPPPPDQAPSAPSAPGAQPQTPMVPPSPGQTFTGGTLPSTVLGSRAGLRNGRPHKGNDYPMNPGTQISVLKGGKVTRSGVYGNYGNLIEIQHDDGSKSAYAHLQSMNVSVGDAVKPGTVIGTVGYTGRVRPSGPDGSHLHFEYDHPNGTGETNWQSINSKADQIFRFGNVKPSDVYKLALENNVEGVVINGEWKPQKWTKEERDRYLRVRGLKEQEEEQISSAGGGSWKPVLDIIGRAESRSNGYNAIAPGDYNPKLSQMTISEANKSVGVNGGRGAIGRYQLTDPIGQAAKAGLKPSDLFSPENQDKIAIALIEGRGVTLDMIKNNPTLAGNLLAGEWAGLPVLSTYNGKQRGQSYYQGYKGNAATVTPKEVEEAFSRAVKSSPSTAKTSPQPSKSTSKPERWAIDPRGWFGMKEGGEVPSIEKPEKKNISPLSSYPSYSEGSSVIMAIQPIIIEKKVPIPVNQGRTSFA